MQMKALKRIRKGGRYVEVGESFDVRSSAEARALKALGRAEAYPSVKSEELVEPEALVPVRVSPVRTRQYHRRDMTVEDETP